MYSYYNIFFCFFSLPFWIKENYVLRKKLEVKQLFFPSFSIYNLQKKTFKCNFTRTFSFYKKLEIFHGKQTVKKCKISNRMYFVDWNFLF